MTTETYDDDVALRAYIRQHFAHLMTPLDRRVTEYITPVVSDSSDSKMIRLYKYLEERDGHVDDTDVVTAFQITYETRIANAVDKLLLTRRNDVVENRCNQCNRLARTPVAKQCLWCGYDWH